MLLKIALPLLMSVMVVLASTVTLFADQRANDRIALMLSGPNCSAHHQTIAQRLYQIPGVKRVDTDLIEGHILIDRVQDRRTAEDFKAIVNEIIPPGSQCLAEIMESCISASPLPPPSQ